MDINPKFPLVQFPFSAGIDEANRAEVVDAGSGWLVLENGRQDQRGGYATRKGFTAPSYTRFDGTTPTSGLKLWSDGTTMARVTDTLKMEAYSSKALAWKDLGRVPEVDYSTHALPNVSSISTPEDIEYCNGYIAVTSTVTNIGFPRIVILDAATMSIVLPPTSIGVIRPLLGSFSSRYFVALSIDPTRIQIYILDTNTATSVAAGWSLLATVGVDYANESVAIESLPDRVAVAYVNNGAGTDRVNVKSYDQTGLLQSTTINTASVKPITVDIRAYPGATTLWCAWSQGLPLKMCGLTTTSLSTVVATTSTVMTATGNWGLVSISPSAASTGRIIGSEGAGSNPRAHMIGFQNSAGATAVVGAQVDLQAVGIVARAFFYGSRHYVAVAASLTIATLPTGNVQKNFILVDWTDDVTWLRPVVNLAPGLAVISTYGKSKCVVGPTATTLYITCAATQSLVGDAGLLVTLDFASLRRWHPIAHGNSVFLPSGITAYSDGLRVSEVGFLTRPTAPTTTFTAAGITGTYRYVAVYEEVDGDGNWHISGVSDPSASVAPANQTVNVTTVPLTVTARISTSGTVTNSSVRIAFYRTLTGGVAPYYRVGVISNDTSSLANTFIDAVTDATLATQAKLYAQPGIIGTSQDRRPPPGLGLLVSYNGMLVGAVGSDVWYSGQSVTGEGVWFNPIFQVPVPGAGPITALAVLDGTLFAFKQRDIYALVGEAPSDNGGSGGIGLPRRLSVDVGAISHVTCATTYGVLFQSDRGIEILTRNQTVDWIGEGVQTTAASWPICTSMTVNPASNIVMIEMALSTSAGVVSGTGRTLVYDLSLRSWVSTDRRTSLNGVVDAPSQSACMIYTGSAWAYGWLGSTGIVHVETTNSIDGNGSMVCKRAVSANVKGSGILGSQYINRTQLLAKRLDPHDLTMSFAYDYSSSFVNARTWTNAELAAFAIPNQQLEHTMGADADCEAVSVQLLDVTPSSGALTTGKAATWIALCFEVVPKSGAYLLPDTSR